jgi:pilus assembly protein Flp/PilA
MLKKLFYDEEGATMTEYILLVVLIAIAAIAVVKLFGGSIQRLFSGSATKLNDEAEGAGMP